MEPRPCSRGNTGTRVPARSDLPPSMEPRPCSRGNPFFPITAHLSPGSFNGATALQPWKPGMTTLAYTQGTTLQWSHGLAAVETRKADRLIHGVYWPSMEPRPCSRGNPPLPVAVKPAAPPSMEPRPCSRGNDHLAGEDQVGVGPSMEPRPCSRGNSGHACAYSLANPSLQWSHGLAAVETRKHWATSTAWTSFNGATALQPWKPFARAHA